MMRWITTDDRKYPRRVSDEVERKAIERGVNRGGG